MPRFLCTINLDDERANYTIGQMLSHLQLSTDQSEFDKVEKLLKKREEKIRIRGEMLGEVVERVKGEARKEMEAEVEKVNRAAEKMRKDVEGKYEELMKWQVVLEKSFEEIENEKDDLVEEVRMLREMNEELKKREEAEKVRSVSELANSKLIVNVEESFEKLEKEKLRLGHEVRLLKEMNQELNKRVEIERVRVSEMEKLKLIVEESFERLKKENGAVLKDNMMFKKEAKVWREEAEKVRNSELSNSKLKVYVEESFEKLEKQKLRLGHEVRLLKEMNQELKKREEAERVRVSEMEKLKLIIEESFERLKKENGAVLKENTRLKNEVRVWREINEEFKNREVAEKVRVLELERKVEIEESLRVRAEEDFEALEKSFKELELRNSVLEKCSNMVMNGGTERVVPTISLMEVASCTERSYVGTAKVNVIDLTDEADDVHSGNMQTGNLMEDSIRLNPSVNLNESSSHTHTTKDKTKSREPIAKPAASRNTTRHGSGSLIRIPIYSGTFDAPLGFKRKRARSVDKENPRESEPSNDKQTCQQLPVHESERTPADCVFSIRPSRSKKGERNKFDGTPGKKRPRNTCVRRKNTCKLDCLS